MANRREVASVLAIAGFTLLTAASGLYLGFVAPRATSHGKPAPIVPDQGAILYEMHSIYSNPGRVRLDWRDVPHAEGYRITVMTPADDSLFTSPVLPVNSWVIPHEKGFPLARQTVYHWKVTVLLPDHTEVSEPAAFATQ
jgi:hypothetical protein